MMKGRLPPEKGTKSKYTVYYNLFNTCIKGASRHVSVKLYRLQGEHHHHIPEGLVMFPVP